MKNLTDFKFDGLAWSNDKDFSVMFDGLVDIGVGYFNNMGKQEIVFWNFSNVVSPINYSLKFIGYDSRIFR